MLILVREVDGSIKTNYERLFSGNCRPDGSSQLETLEKQFDNCLHKAKMEGLYAWDRYIGFFRESIQLDQYKEIHAQISSLKK